MLRLTRNRFYAVPVLMRALDILEFLHQSSSPFTMREISEGTGVCPTTTYRIVRTLVYRGYVAQDLEGRFKLLKRPEVNAASTRRTDAGSTPPVRLRRNSLSGNEVIEVLHNVLQTLRQGYEGNLNHDTISKHSHHRRHK